jgi:putative molybdopterin biosynthesis protein
MTYTLDKGGAMSGEMMSTKEVAQYLGIHEKQVYALIKAQRIPSTKITGKWIFPRTLIDEWVGSHARQGVEKVREKSRRIEGALLACGSNDPILDMLQTYLKKTYPEIYIFSANTGSTDGLKTLNKGFTDIAWSHLLDPKSSQYNIPFLPTYVPDVEAVVVNLFHRELGLIVTPENPFGIKGFEDLSNKGVRFVNRQQGSGTRVLLDYHLRELTIPSAKIKGYEKEVYTHFEVGLSILSKEADVGIATIAIAKLLGLHFIPIAEESFDMILDQRTFFRKEIQALIDTLNSRDFRLRVEPIGAYDFKDSGRILYSSN